MTTSLTSLTLATINGQIRDLLSDNINYTPTAPDSLSPNTWTDSQVTDAINYAIKEYCMAKKATYTEVSVAVSTIGVSTIPTDYIEIERVSYLK